MQALFTTLTRAIESTPLWALSASFLWGILSVVLSPCHLSSIPLIIAFIDHQGRPGARRACVLATSFSLGIMVTIALVGLVTAALGRIAGDVGPVGNYVVAAVFIVVGLYLLDVIPLPWQGPGQTALPGRGVLAALGLGLVFGIAVGPCTFAYMAPMLGVTFRLATTRLLYGISLLLAYAVGHCLVIVVAGTSAGLVQRYLSWNESSGGATALKRVCGALVIAAGLYWIWTA